MGKQIVGAVLLAATALAALTDPVLAQQADQGKTPKQAGKSPVKVFILAGQSNMEGQGSVDAKDEWGNAKKGTLLYLLNDPAKAPMVKHLKDARGEWTVRGDVWVYSVTETGLAKGGLSVGYGWAPGNKGIFGPELQFGHMMGDYLGNQVLIIKTAWGGQSLYKDFRPPSSGGEVGPRYKEMLETVDKALANLKTEFPGYDGGGYELAGFVWYQGWNDGCDPKNAVPEYEKNLVNLIQDLRKDLKAPKLPVVVAELTGCWVHPTEQAWIDVRKAQADAAAHPEFKGSVLFVETHDFVRDEKDSPGGWPCHEWNNAETYFLVGNAMGEGMKKLLKAACTDEKPDPPKPQSRTIRNIEGWIVRVDERLLVPPNDELGLRAFKLLEAKLADIKYVMAEEPLAKLQTVPIVLDLTHGKLRVMQYHPDADWLEANGYSTDLVKCVHIPEAADLFTPRNINEQPWVVLHELAHAYHDRVLGFDAPQIKEAYKRAVKDGQYESVLHISGRMKRHYGLTDHKEYFAEASEAFFGTNDFYPFVRAELKQHDPKLYELLEEVWDTKRDRDTQATRD